MSQIAKILSAVVGLVPGATKKSVTVECIGRGAKNSSGEVYQTPGVYGVPVSTDIGLSETIGENRIFVAVNDYQFSLLVQLGEVVIYSRSGPGVLQGYTWYKNTGEILTKNNVGSVKLDPTGTHTFNDGLISAVKFDELKAGFDQLKAEFNAHIHNTTATVGLSPAGVISPPTVASTASIDSSEVSQVKFP